MMSDEEKLEGLKRTGRVQDDEITGKSVEDDEPTPPPEPTVPPKKEEPVVPPPEKKEEPKVDPAIAPVVLPKDEITPPPSNPQPRPVKYKPLEEYTAEKREWKAAEEAKDRRIAELEVLAKANTAQPETPKTEEKISKFADKYGFDVEDVKDMLSGLNTGAQVPKEVAEQLEALKQKDKQSEEQKLFDNEFTALQPALTSQYPSATAEQLVAAKAHLDELSHSKDFHTYSLDYILFKNKSTMDEIFKKADEKPTDPPPRKTVENGRIGHNANTPISAKDFNGQKDFSQLLDMDPTNVKQIIKDMDPSTYGAYVGWVASQENEGGVKVQRDGRTIILK